MAELRMFTIAIAYTVDVMLKCDDNGKHVDTAQMEQTLKGFGATDITMAVDAYTGKGEHEFVGSTDPGLAHLSICVKCSMRRDKATKNCPGVLS